MRLREKINETGLIPSWNFYITNVCEIKVRKNAYYTNYWKDYEILIFALK